MIHPRTVPFEREHSPPRAGGLRPPLSPPTMPPPPSAPMPMPVNTRVATVLGRGAAVYGRGREVAALVLWTLALFFALALASYQGDPTAAAGPATPPGPDWVGPAGALGARGLVS